MENGDIPDSRITASSHSSAQYPPHFVKRLSDIYVWMISPHEHKNTNHWLLVDLGKVYTVLGIGERGDGYNIREILAAVKTYSLQYSNNSEDFIDYNGGMVINASYYRWDPVLPKNYVDLLKPPIKARYIKLIPKSWYNTITISYLIVRTKEGIFTVFFHVYYLKHNNSIQ